MKFLKKAILATLMLGFAGLSAAATPTMNWMIKSSEPLEQITFGLTINAAAPTDEFYFAYQFGFTDGGDIGYTGIQPTKNSADGNRQFMVLFSSFRKDTSPDHENCKGGADGAKAGATCRLYIPGELGDTFRFKVTKSGQTVTGTVLNETSGREDTIGQWTVGASAGTLAESQIAWIENYKMNNPNYKLSCDNKGWPYYQLKFLPPVGNNGDVAGMISSISRGSDTCPGAIKSTHDASGTLVEGGFK